jgi:transcriptional regulator with XRE-family HTH domain
MMSPKDVGRAAELEREIGARIRTRRRQLGLSQGDLDEQLGVSFQQVQKYERRANRLDPGGHRPGSGRRRRLLVGEEMSRRH